MSDLISRKAAIEAINTWDKFGVDERSRIVRWCEGLEPYVHLRDVLTAIVNLPSEQQMLYGYKIEHLAYIAKVMEKEGITAEYAVRTFDDMSRAIRMIIEEAQQKAEEMLNERFNQQTGGD